MTNDYDVLKTKLKTLGYSIHDDFRLLPNDSLKQLRKKMSDIKADFAFSQVSVGGMLHYYDATNDRLYLTIFNYCNIGNNKISVKKILHNIRNNQIESIKELVESGYDINQPLENGITPLMFACFFDAGESVKILLDLGADINYKSIDGFTPLMFSIFSNSKNAAKILLENEHLDLELKNNLGNTALLEAADNPYFLALLIKAGADINSRNFKGQTALIRSIIVKNNISAGILLKLNADYNKYDKMGVSPLIYAACFDRVYVVKKLLEKNADTNIEGPKLDCLFLIAYVAGSFNVLKMLLETENISKDVYSQAVIECAFEGQTGILSILLNNSKSNYEHVFFSLIISCITDNSELLKICKNNQYNVNDCFFYNMTPLMIACFENSNNIVEELIEDGADLNKVDDFGMTALMYAAKKNNQAIITILLRNGAESSIKNKDGKTFENYFGELDNRSYLQLFIDRGNQLIVDNKNNKDTDVNNQKLSFSKRFNWYLKKYLDSDSNNKPSDVYKNGGLSKQTFSKINSNRNNDFRPKKDTVIQLALGLKLTLDETEDLLQRAGYMFSNHDKKDLEIRKLFSDGNFNKNDWSERIYNSTGKIFFSALIERDDDECKKGSIYTMMKKSLDS